MTTKPGLEADQKLFETKSPLATLENLRFLSLFTTSVEYHLNHGGSPFTDGIDGEGSTAQQLWDEAWVTAQTKSEDRLAVYLSKVWFCGDAFDRWFLLDYREKAA